MTIAFTNDELALVANALRVAANVYEKDVDAIPEYHYKLRDQLREQANIAYNLALRIEEEA